LRRYDLLRVDENLDEVLCEFTLIGRDVRVRGTFVSGTTGTSDTMNVVLNTIWHVIVDLYTGVQSENERGRREEGNFRKLVSVQRDRDDPE
jgi:hypothetical protein